MKTNQLLKGFTLIELMAVIAVVGVLMAIAVPYMGNMSKNALADRIYRDLELDFRYARSQAATLGKTVQFKPSNNWVNGWELKEGTNVLRSKAIALPSGTVTSSNLSNASPVTFDGKGYANKDVEIVIKVDGCTGNRVRKIIVNRIGQIQLKEVTAC